MATTVELSAAVKRLSDALYVARVIKGQTAEQKLTAARQALRDLRIGSRQAA